jgi:hypothetical protein
VLNAPSGPAHDLLYAHYGCSVFFGNRVKKRMEKVRPAKKVEAALAVWPPRKLKTAEAVQLIMIRTINTIRVVRKVFGGNIVVCRAFSEVRIPQRDSRSAARAPSLVFLAELRHGPDSSLHHTLDLAASPTRCL